MPVPPAPHEDYPLLDESGLRRYLTGVPTLVGRLGGAPADWVVREIGDGNVNFVFAVHGPQGAVCVKQAVPYVRAIGPEWPLTPDRILFEHRAIVEHRRHASAYVPEPLHIDAQLRLLAVEYLDGHTVMRHGLTTATRYGHFADHMAEYLARTLFFTSDLALPAHHKRALISWFETNTEMCRIMEDMVFTDIYLPHPRNEWTSPELDEDVALIRQDTELKLAVSRLKSRYLSARDALIHGDLHTGSIMISDDRVHVIDQEFACYGPLGFDLGNVLAHLLISYFAQEQREHTQKQWLLETVERLWDGFREHFAALWRASASGDAYPQAMFATPSDRTALEEERQDYLDRLFTETLGFCGAEILRRVIGFARPTDFTSISDPRRRAASERRALRLARDLVTGPGRYKSAADLTAAAGHDGPCTARA
ncbi:S-methyl-5-thioribose kinase [Embleya sp. NBC_00896]|uniref:S-methyl-5-thioribose kinase n=1 Tax=Embleya sp. NBC_00896 TaxID=2975961 RepID=UPI002F910091|nr:S-methyl-5-thioribose kinase [Embleya sp. NBC_00896]